jgi:hypothetical protein
MHTLLMQVDDLENKNAISCCFQSNLNIFTTKKLHSNTIGGGSFSSRRRRAKNPLCQLLLYQGSHAHILKQLVCMT